MSKKLESFLQSIGVTDSETIAAELLNDEQDGAELLDTLRKSAQTYARPFIESEFVAKGNEERKTYKGKYFKDALGIANKIFGSPLTQNEIDTILKDPKNEGKTLDVAIEALKTKVSTKTGASETELQAMLDLANGKITEYEAKIPELEAQSEKKIKEAINQFKLDGVISKSLLSVLADKTDNPVKIAELIKTHLGTKAVIKLKDDGTIGLYDSANPESPLKKNDTTLQTFDGLVNDTIEHFGLTKKSNGTEKKGIDTMPKTEDRQTGATGLAAKFAMAVGS